MNPFKILNIKKSYNIDKSELERKYLEMQMIYHPDRASSDEEKEYFLSFSININNSYKILQNDYDRAILLLNLEKIDHNHQKLSNEFLEHILEQNEEINNQASKLDLEHIIKLLNTKYKDLYHTIVEAFEVYNYDLASKKTMEMKYISNLITIAKEKLRCCN